jgi:hypothetical protein
VGLLFVPDLDEEPWPTLGGGICDLIEERCVYGPGSLQGLAYEIEDEFRAFIYRAFEVYPQVVSKAFAGGGPGLIVKDPHPWAGRRRFSRCGLCIRKGLAKTEKMALLAFCELHPEGPTRCDGFDASGNPVGRPVRAPYIPMLAVTVEQVEELAYGALKYICEEGPDADLFDVSLERIVRLDERGRADGKAVALANSPGARDGARTTMNCFDEPHRLILPRQKSAHTTMDGNLPKRTLEGAWSLYVGTAGELGEESVAEELHLEAEQIRDGLIERADLFYLYRTDDNPERDLRDKNERIAAIAEASGPAGEWGPGQFDEIASKWDRPKADHAYLERVWLNRWKKSGSQAFNVARWRELDHLAGDPEADLAPPIPHGAMVTVGFDGARFRDSTGFVLTEVATGRQMLAAGWERPLDLPDDQPWEINDADVHAALAQIHDRWDVWRGNADPPHWVEEVGAWCGRYPDTWQEWWTNRPKAMSYAVRDYREAMTTGAVTWCADDELAADFGRHIGNAGRSLVNLWDDEGRRLFVLQKIHPDRKFDYAMAGCLSWQGRLEAIRSGAQSRKPTTFVPSRIR